MMISRSDQELDRYDILSDLESESKKGRVSTERKKRRGEVGR